MGVLTAQDFAESVPTPEAAALYSELLPAGLDARYDGEGLLYGVRAFTTYDSNVFLSEPDPQGALSVNFSPWAQYSSAPPGGAEWILNGRYSPFFRWFATQDELSSIDHSGEMSLSYEGPRLGFRTSAGYSRVNAADRFAGGRFTNERFTTEFLGGYYVSDRSILQCQLAAGSFAARLNETQTYLAQLTAFWQVTPLIRLGPALRYTARDSNITGDANSLGLLVSAAYDLTDLVEVTAALGVEQIDQSLATGADGGRVTGALSASYDAPDLPWSARLVLDYGAVQSMGSSSRFGAGGESPWTGRFSVRYAFAEFWALNFSMRYESFPSPSATGVSIDDFTVSGSATRSVGNNRLRGGVSVSLAEFTSLADSATPIDDQKTYSAFLTHRIGVFEERFYIDSSVRYSNNRGRGGDWSRWQITTGINFIF